MRKASWVGLLVVLITLSGVGQEMPSDDAAVTSRGAPESDSRDPGVSFELMPGAFVPLGESARYFKSGASVGAAARRSIPSLKNAFLLLGAAYDYDTTQADTAVSAIGASAGAGYQVALGDRFELSLFGSAGWYYSSLHGSQTNGNALSLNVGTNVSFLLSPLLDAAVGCSYRRYEALHSGLTVFAGTRLHPWTTSSRERRIAASPLWGGSDSPRTSAPGRGISIGDPQLDDIFPVFHTWYDSHPLGTVTLRNLEGEPVEDVRVSLLVRQYMDSPKECARFDSFPAGATRQVDVLALLNERIMQVTEGTKVAGDLAVEYRMAGHLYRDVRTITIRVLDRNAMTWNDDRRVAAFVTAKDPEVMRLAKEVVAVVGDRGVTAIDRTLQVAMGVHEALRLHGLAYTVDPTTPFVELSATHHAVDYLQFPRQTLSYRAGDCDDLSILYASALESVGVESAFVTVPGHIFVACALETPPDEAARTLLSMDDLIVHNERVWLPIEVTERNGSFLVAWSAGAKTWRQYDSEHQSELILTHDAWQLYEPVALAPDDQPVSLPDRQTIASAFDDVLTRFVERQLSSRIARLERSIETAADPARVRNQLGVLYARYGLLGDAAEQFHAILERREYVPAVVNLGNVHYLAGEWTQALAYYDRAATAAPESAPAILGLARVHHELENYGMVRTYYARLRDQDPRLAEQYAYLEMRDDESGRASDVLAASGRAEWMEE